MNMAGKLKRLHDERGAAPTRVRQSSVLSEPRMRSAHSGNASGVSVEGATCRRRRVASASSVSRRRVKSSCAFSASATVRPSRDATSWASAVRAACSRPAHLPPILPDLTE